MGYNEQLAERVRSMLSGSAGIEEKRMFGGIAFMVNGKMCVTAGDDELMFRVDPSLHDALIQEPGCHTVIMKGRAYKGWVYVHEEALRNDSELTSWIKLALDFNAQLK